MILLSWALAAISVLGVSGTIVALVFFPTVALPVFRAVLTAILACKRCLYTAAILGACLASWWFGHHRAVLDCRAAELSAQLAAQKADLEHATQAAADETKRANQIEADANAQHSKDAAYIAHLKAKPACAFDDSDVGPVRRRLRYYRKRHHPADTAAAAR